MRESDVLSLMFDENIVNNRLQVVVNKSLETFGVICAVRLSWDLAKNEYLASLIESARPISNELDDCPFIVAHKPDIRRLGDNKMHICQLLPRRLIDMFKEAREHAGLHLNLPPGVKPPSFHEVRSLSAKEMLNGDPDNLERVRKVMGHKDIATTRIYLGGHADLPYEEVLALEVTR